MSDFNGMKYLLGTDEGGHAEYFEDYKDFSIFNAPEQVPGRYNLVGQQRPWWLQEADYNYSECIKETDNVMELYEDGHIDSIFVVMAQARENEAAIKAHELYLLWQAGKMPEIFNLESGELRQKGEL